MLDLQQYRNYFQDLWHKQWWIHRQERVSLDDNIHSHQSGGHTNCLSGQQIINECPQYLSDLVKTYSKPVWNVLNFLQHIISFQSEVWQGQEWEAWFPRVPRDDYKVVEKALSYNSKINQLQNVQYKTIKASEMLEVPRISEYFLKSLKLYKYLIFLELLNFLKFLIFL